MVHGMILRTVFFTALILLAVMHGASAGCAVTPVAVLSAADVAHFVTVPAAVNGRAVTMILDTGADAALVTPDAAEALRLPLDPARLTRIEGTGGSAGIAPHVILDTLALGALRVDGLSAPVGDLPAAPRMVPPVAGLIGADLLARFDWEFDLPHRRLVLHTVADTRGPGPACADAMLPSWSGETDALALIRSGDRLLAEVRLDGQPATALIDTGARSIVVSRRVAARVGVGPEALAADPGGITGGVDLNETAFHWHRFRSLQIGGETIRTPVLTVSRVADQAGILLGSPYFATRRVWLSYATNRMFVQAAAPPPARKAP